MNSIGNIFPIRSLDKRWFYSSVVSGAHSNGSSSGAKSEGVSKKGGEKSGTGLDRTKSSIPDATEMRKVFEKFDENNDGVIASDELSRFMKRLGFQMSDDEVASLVKTLDGNSDGTVDFEEFYSLYASLTGTDKKQSESDDKAIEKNHDDNLREAFSVFDKDQDGFISVQELQTVLSSLGMTEGNSFKKCRQMITSVDDDGDGQVNFAEFKKMMDSDAFNI